MTFLETFLAWVVPVTVLLVFTALALWLIRRWIADEPESRVRRQLLQVAVVILALIVLALMVPLETDTRGQLLSLFGLLLTGVLGLASTTFVSNAMAGFMLRSVASFRTGDFVRVGEHFGRVTETALLHTEIQSEDRDLITLPNLFLITQPVRVVRASGTLISADVSLGYDVHRQRVRECLLAAAADAELTEAFVLVLELGDFSISYRISGFLQDVRPMVSKRSELRSKLLDRLHEDGIEIVSPNFMNQRQLPADQQFLPKRYYHPERVEDRVDAEKIMFDKADLAERVEGFRTQRQRLAEELKNLSEDSDAFERTWRERQIASLDDIIVTLNPEPNEIR
ncbi:MAG: mechanosensitive ion channel domain-containing protein [Pseudomonadales bacterium]